MFECLLSFVFYLLLQNPRSLSSQNTIMCNPTFFCPTGKNDGGMKKPTFILRYYKVHLACWVNSDKLPHTMHTMTEGGAIVAVIIWLLDIQKNCSTTYAICPSPLMLWVRLPPRAGCTTLFDKVYLWLAAGRWCSFGPPVSSIN